VSPLISFLGLRRLHTRHRPDIKPQSVMAAMNSACVAATKRLLLLARPLGAVGSDEKAMVSMKRGAGR
jgi:hypothetical protein